MKTPKPESPKTEQIYDDVPFFGIALFVIVVLGIIALLWLHYG